MNTTHKNIANHSFLGILFLALFITGNAQTKSLSKIYLQAGGGGGTQNSGCYDLSLQAIFKNKWSATLSYQGHTMAPKNLPSDYQPETGYVLFIPYTDEAEVSMNLISLTAGKYFKLGKNTWATLEGGPSYVKGEKANFQRSSVTDINILFAASTSSNYDYTTEKKSSLGMMLKADVNWGLTSFMGLGAGVYANFNSIQSPVGFQVKLMIGNMGRVKRNK